MQLLKWLMVTGKLGSLSHSVQFDFGHATMPTCLLKAQVFFLPKATWSAFCAFVAFFSSHFNLFFLCSFCSLLLPQSGTLMQTLALFFPPICPDKFAQIPPLSAETQLLHFIFQSYCHGENSNCIRQHPPTSWLTSATLCSLSLSDTGLSVLLLIPVEPINIKVFWTCFAVANTLNVLFSNYSTQAQLVTYKNPENVFFSPCNCLQTFSIWALTMTDCKSTIGTFCPIDSQSSDNCWNCGLRELNACADTTFPKFHVISSALFKASFEN